MFRRLWIRHLWIRRLWIRLDKIISDTIMVLSQMTENLISNLNFTFIFRSVRYFDSKTLNVNLLTTLTSIYETDRWENEQDLCVPSVVFYVLYSFIVCLVSS